MAYSALYREWRPQTFPELIGQEHVSRTLQNALIYGRVAHAYLFCGPRGTGKTTTAKILAKALNCTGGATEADRPCNACPNCQAVNLGTARDVLEIDAASNRGVDEIRELREQVKYAPQEGKYKVYIIDEVHMLTTEAFNALLKTLEEPPANVVFVLATTEAHKVPATVLSRCQRFDFRRLGIEQITDQLTRVCRHEDVQADPEILRYIARKADGGMRDALSILDQCIAFGGSPLTLADVTVVLGTVEDEQLYSLAQHLGQGDLGGALVSLNEIFNAGKEIRLLTRDLMEHYRDRLILQTVPGGEELVAIEAGIVDRIKQNPAYSPAELESCLVVLGEAENQMKWSSYPRILLEVAFVRVARREMPKDPANKPAPSLKEAERPAAVSQKEAPGGPNQADGLDLDLVQEQWPDVVERVINRVTGLPGLRVLLEEQTRVVAQEDRVYLVHNNPRFPKVGDSRLEAVAAAAQAEFAASLGVPVRVFFWPEKHWEQQKGENLTKPQDGSRPGPAAPWADPRLIREVFGQPDLAVEFAEDELFTKPSF
ncbi:MAG: DNA polymerase III subunit gamma/tau [Heliobacteriaceae bacterium]|nr:DNA polymerase III subunit gamma/tau [Heliobacteriaceae bacterium]MDD4587723.1 DNA polymerase III subunit gamma/tau [Heliobacteriaceae bacterium]